VGVTLTFAFGWIWTDKSRFCYTTIVRKVSSCLETWLWSYKLASCKFSVDRGLSLNYNCVVLDMSSVLTHLGWSKFQMLLACLEWLSKLSCPTATFVPLAAQMGFILLEVWHQALITSNFTTHLRQKSLLSLNILFEWHLLVLQLVHQLTQPEQTCLESWAEHECFPICIVTRKCCSRNKVVPSCTTIYRNIKSPGCGCAFLYADNVE
jgi:hypothetical protein